MSPSAALPHQRNTHTHCHSPHSHPVLPAPFSLGLPRKGLYREAVREAGVSRHSLISLSVSEHNEIQQHASTWITILPLSFVLWKLGTLQRSWLYPQLCDNRVLRGSQSLLFKDGPMLKMEV